MQPSNALVRTEPYSTRATSTSTHPQLRDLVVYTPEAGNAVSVICYDSLCSVDLWSSRPPEYTPLKFSPTTISYGMGLVAAGGQSSEIALKSATPGCHQHLPATSPPSATGVRTVFAGSINNSIFISPSPTSASTPRLLVSNNDEKIAIYEVGGHPPDYKAAKRRRVRERREGWSVVEAGWAAERGEKEYGVTSSIDRRRGCWDDGDVDERPSYDEGGECHLVPLPAEDIRLQTAVNHCSVSHDGRRMVAVGDTNEVFLYDVRAGGYELAHTFEASSDASFSTDWSEDGVTFAVASQDGYVHVYDVRCLPSTSRPATPSGSSSYSPRKVAELKTTQTGPAGAARKVKFSPGGARLDGGLMAFTEHRNRVHVVDARTFETYQILEVPNGLSSAYSYDTGTVNAPFPPLRPRPQPPPRAFRPPRPPLSRFGSTLSSGTRTPKDEVERAELEREMRERVEQRLLEQHRSELEEMRDVRRIAEEQREARRREGVLSDSEEEEEDGEGQGDGEGWEEQSAGEVDEAMADVPPEEEDDDETESDASSAYTTRPSRLRPPSLSQTAPWREQPPSWSASWASRAPTASSSEPITPFSNGLSNTSTSSVSDHPPVRRNFSGYAPLQPNSTSRSLPSFASATRSSTNYYYSTYVPASTTTATSTSATPSLPFFSRIQSTATPAPPVVNTAGPRLASLFAAPLAGGGAAYHSPSAFFPLDTAPGDLLGLDWDEWGERLIVATGERLWEWDVDVRARRGSAAWGTR
ncbi:hypothetical protein JCM10207_008704 [Rhodosporidiobolus poonsookiae]